MAKRYPGRLMIQTGILRGFLLAKRYPERLIIQTGILMKGEKRLILEWRLDENQVEIFPC